MTNEDFIPADQLPPASKGTGYTIEELEAKAKNLWPTKYERKKGIKILDVKRIITDEHFAAWGVKKSDGDIGFMFALRLGTQTDRWTPLIFITETQVPNLEKLLTTYRKINAANTILKEAGLHGLHKAAQGTARTDC